MSLDSTIDTIIYIYIGIFILWLIIGFILFCIAYYKLFGFTSALNPKEYQEPGTEIIVNIIYYLYLLYISLTYLVYIGSSLLLIIFGFWVFIVDIVPFIILIPLPFIPFILPVPIKNILLEFVPPFKQLTRNGLLPMMRRIIFSIKDYFPQGKIRQWIGYSSGEIYNFIYNDIKRLFKNVGNAIGIDKEPPPPSEENKIEDKYEVKQSNDEKAQIKNDEEAKEIRKMIDEEIAICVKSKQQFKTPQTTGSDEMNAANENINIYSECQAIGIKSYFDNLI